MELSTAIQNILACPYCGERLMIEGNEVLCKKDKFSYPYTENGALDLRLPKVKNVQVNFKLGPQESTQREISYELLKKNENPENDFSSIKNRYNISEYDLSHFPKAKSENSLALDLGCGDARHREIFELAGFEYVGFDLLNPKAPILADAQAIPFLDNSFEFIFAKGVIAQIPFPFPMINDVYRVLEPGGIFMGFVSFLTGWENFFHYMYTRLGIQNLLEFPGFKVKVIAPDRWWTGLYAVGNMGLYPRMPEFANRVLVTPLEWLSKLWWKAGSMKDPRFSETERLARTTGGFTFIAEK